MKARWVAGSYGNGGLYALVRGPVVFALDSVWCDAATRKALVRDGQGEPLPGLAGVALDPDEPTAGLSPAPTPERAIGPACDVRIALADSQFHRRIYEAAHNGVLISVRDGFALYEGFYFHGDFYRYTPEAFAQSLKRHRQMMEAIARREAGAAEQAARRHMQEATKLVHDGQAKPREVQLSATSRPARRRRSSVPHGSVSD